MFLTMRGYYFRIKLVGLELWILQGQKFKYEIVFEVDSDQIYNISLRV